MFWTKTEFIDGSGCVELVQFNMPYACTGSINENEILESLHGLHNVIANLGGRFMWCHLSNYY
jgi:hypothetical protein